MTLGHFFTDHPIGKTERAMRRKKELKVDRLAERQTKRQIEREEKKD